MAKLLIQESNGAREFELVDQEINIGRELDNTLRLADPSISRHHALLRRTPSGFQIEDLGSSNGVLINGAKVPASPVHHGDRITLGQLQLTFIDPPQGETNPLGTMRMNLEEMARIQAGDTHPAFPPRKVQAEAPAPQPPPPVPEPTPMPAPMPAPAPARPPAPATPQAPLPSRTEVQAPAPGGFLGWLKSAWSALRSR